MHASQLVCLFFRHALCMCVYLIVCMFVCGPRSVVRLRAWPLVKQVNYYLTTSKASKLCRHRSVVRVWGRDQLDSWKRKVDSRMEISRCLWHRRLHDQTASHAAKWGARLTCFTSTKKYKYWRWRRCSCSETSEMTYISAWWRGTRIRQVSVFVLLYQ